jgi:N-methylhydantoinase B/oxoprolinase/acetone carboxylase alpha subunit
MRVLTGGGGGYGPPAERDPEVVRSDVREGYISEAAAQRDYGVLSKNSISLRALSEGWNRSQA